MENTDQLVHRNVLTVQTEYVIQMTVHVGVKMAQEVSNVMTVCFGKKTQSPHRVLRSPV